ncbi:acyl transferase/acyl hydrolase/lysophospholipase [Ochromonadaceae sp. CCMP2298]|nr:acyl transferase/acyl hydrolase/lysophospholipase [Ochromonadaceae sp. CCMP2298]
MNKLLGTIARTIARLTTPHLNKILRSERPIAFDWRLDTRPLPPNVPGRTATQRDPAKKVDVRRPYRILCLDGGGIRGILTTTILKRICKHKPSFLDNVDLIVGTSAGGLLSLLLASGYTADECDDIYSFAGNHIFGHNPWRAINPFRAKYSDKAKQELLQHYYGTRTMGDLQKTCAVIAFRLDGRKSHTHRLFNKEGWRPAVFSNMPQAGGLIRPDDDLLVWDAAMRTSAAPTFFPVFRGYTDGGIVANNPTVVAISKAMAHYPHLNMGNIAVLSIGAGTFPRHLQLLSKHSSGNHSNGDTEAVEESSPLWRADWGIKQWIPYLLDIILDGDSVTTEMVVQYLLAANGLYHRIDPRLPRWIALDEVTAAQQDFDNDLHNSLDSSSSYNDAWHRSVQSQEAQQQKPQENVQ